MIQDRHCHTGLTHEKGAHGALHGGFHFLGYDSALQLAHPVREAEDLAVPGGLRAEARAEATSAHGVPGQLVHPAVVIDLARNPYDFWPLITEAHREWTVGSDALVDGAPLPDTLGLLREGFRRMKLELLLGTLADEVAALPAGGDKSFGLAAEGAQADIRDGIVKQSIKVVHPCLLDVVSTRRGWLQGHLLWVRPDLRGRGLVGGYFDAALRWAKERGLHGMHFTSTLPFWERRAPRYGFTRGITINQRIGPPAVGWYREV